MVLTVRRRLVLAALALVIGAVATVAAWTAPSDSVGLSTSPGETAPPSELTITPLTPAPPADVPPAPEVTPTSGAAPTTTAAVAPPTSAERDDDCIPGTRRPNGSCEVRPATLTGHVSDTSGRPVPGICLGSPLLGGELGRTGSDGRYRFDLPPSTSFPIDLWDCAGTSSFGWLDQTLWTALPSGRTTVLNATMTELAGLTGVVVDPSGAPVAGVCVWSAAEQPTQSAPTAADGRFTLPGVVPGDQGVNINPCPKQALLVGTPLHHILPGGWVDIVVVVLPSVFTP